MGTLVLEVQNPNRLYLQSELLSEDAARLQEGTAVRAVQKDYGQTLDGLTVSQIAPKAHAATSSLGAEQRRLPVTIALPAGALPVPLGTQWDVTFTLADIADALWLPKACVYTRGQDSVVLLPDGRTERPVTTGIRQGDRIEIVEGLEEGDQVLLPK